MEERGVAGFKALDALTYEECDNMGSAWIGRKLNNEGFTLDLGCNIFIKHIILRNGHSSGYRLVFQ